MASICDAYELTLLEVLRTLAAGAGVWVKLHIGDPGETAASNAAGETTRKQVTFAAAAAGAMASNVALTWASVSTAETISHASLWTTVGPAGGTPLWGGTVTVPRAVLVGDTFEIPSAGLVVGLD